MNEQRKRERQNGLADISKLGTDSLTLLICLIHQIFPPFACKLVLVHSSHSNASSMSRLGFAKMSVNEQQATHCGPADINML